MILGQMALQDYQGRLGQGEIRVHRVLLGQKVLLEDKEDEARLVGLELLENKDSPGNKDLGVQ